jgi:hypothetical protein
MAQLDRVPPRGKVHRYRKLLFWAQGGCVCVENEDEAGAFKSMSRVDAVARVILFKQAVDEGAYNYADERIEATNFIVNWCDSVREAKRQGDPFDPEVLAQQLRERQNSKGYIYLGDGSTKAINGFSQTDAALIPKIFIPGPGQKVVLRTGGSADFPQRAKELPAFGPPPRKG